MRFKEKFIKIFIIIFIMQFVFYKYSYATSDNQAIVPNDEQIDGEMRIYSESAILIENKTGKVLYEKDMHARKYPASTTKILTAILAIEKCDLKEVQIASDAAVNSIKPGYSTANIQVGETFTVEELLNVMIIHSANEAANILAEHISGSMGEFAKLMNEKAKEIGCLDTNFVNANGAHDENHYSTAYDMALIARYCMQNETFRKLVTTMECSLPNTELWQEPRVYRNTNSLLLADNRYYYPYCNGIKTGFTTPAKNCLISSSNKDGFETIAVVLHAESTEEGLSARYLDTINLFEYGYNNYNLDDILEEYDMHEYENIEEKEESRSFISGIVSNDEIDNTPSITIEDKKITIKSEITKILIGIVLLIRALWIIINRKKGKHAYNKRLYLRESR